LKGLRIAGSLGVAIEPCTALAAAAISVIKGRDERWHVERVIENPIR
jgi:hypothetical protein